jgi:excisionase family DNA binding protein
MSDFELRLVLSDEQLDEVAGLVAARLGGNGTQEASTRWLTVDQAAEYIGAKPKRIYDLRSSGRLSRTGDGSRVLVDRQELDDLIGGVR